MAYTFGSTNVDLGSQQVNVHPSQPLTSLNANKLMLGVIEPGVYNLEVQVIDGASDVTFRIVEGATLVFKKIDTPSNPSSPYLLGKFYFQDNADIVVPKTTLTGYSEAGLLVIASWEYDITDSSSIYCNPMVVPYTTDNVTQANDDNDLILAVILNHAEFLSGGHYASAYRVSYQEQTYRNPMKNLFEVSSGFPINFGFTGLSITVGAGNCVLGDTYVHNYSTLTCASGSNWLALVATGSPSSYYQIDVLRLKTERDSVSTNTPYLSWESFLKATPMSNGIRRFIDGFDFTWEDQGYNLLFAVRARNGLAINTPIWPLDCFIVNPFTPQIGIPETLSRFKLPVY